MGSAAKHNFSSHFDNITPAIARKEHRGTSLSGSQVCHDGSAVQPSFATHDSAVAAVVSLACNIAVLAHSASHTAAAVTTLPHAEDQTRPVSRTSISKLGIELDDAVLRLPNYKPELLR